MSPDAATSMTMLNGHERRLGRYRNAIEARPKLTSPETNCVHPRCETEDPWIEGERNPRIGSTIDQGPLPLVRPDSFGDVINILCTIIDGNKERVAA